MSFVFLNLGIEAANDGVYLSTRWAWIKRALVLTLVDMVRRWYLYGPVLLIWLLTAIRVLVDPTPRLPILVNWSPSLPFTLVVVEQGTALHRGDYVVFSFAGEAQLTYPGLRGQPFFKRIAGLPGDRVTVIDRHVYVNGIDMGYAKPRTFDGRSLEPIAPLVIPAGYYYVQGTSADSLDSRYRIGGLVRADQILRKVRPLF